VNIKLTRPFFNLLRTKRINMDTIIMLMVRKSIYFHFFFCKWDNLTEQKKAIQVSTTSFLLEKMRFENKLGRKQLIIFFMGHTLMKGRFLHLSAKMSRVVENLPLLNVDLKQKKHSCRVSFSKNFSVKFEISKNY